MADESGTPRQVLQPQSDLDRLCLRCGIMLGYTDIWGEYHEAPQATKLALLRAMGVALRDTGQAAAALEQIEEAEWKEILPPVRVGLQGEGRLQLTCTLSERAHPKSLTWQLRLESGRHMTGQWRQAAAPLETRRIGANLHGRYAFELPGELPLGYHDLSLLDPADTTRPLATARIIMCPPKCHDAGEERIWGIATQLYALRSGRNWGMGDFGDLAKLAESAADMGASIIGINPLHALFPGNPEAASPYSPSNRAALNVLYLDVEAVPDFTETPEARARVASETWQQRLHGLRATELVDYAGVAGAKLEILELLYRNFRAQHLAPRDGKISERAVAFRAFQAAAGETLRLQAVFDALQDHFSSRDAAVWGWPAWPDAYRRPSSVAVEMFCRSHAERVDFFSWLQWQADLQLAQAADRGRSAGLSAGIYRDLAVGSSSAGAETWMRAPLYALAARVGAPPDEINSVGQDWGLPPMIPAALRRARFEPFVELLRANMRHAGALRIDHVMGLFRLYWVPPEATPREGSYVLYPFREMMGILALESRRNGCRVIGEDLGTVPQEVHQAMESFGVLSYRPLYFERDEEGEFRPPEAYARRALVTAGTHDLPTLAGFWAGTDLRERETHRLFGSEALRAGQWRGRAADRERLLTVLEKAGTLPAGLTPESPYDERIALAAHAMLASTPARIMMIQLEDVLGQVEQVNLPGTTDEQHPNWRRKLALPLEAWAGDACVNATADAINALRGTVAPHLNENEEEALPTSRAQLVIPRATYRLQFNRDFTFDQATAIVPYLSTLGISHVYASPFFQARPGSSHGYDITDHNAFNPEIGSAADFERFSRALRENGMALMLDLVPNHMGIMGADNQWWLDVMENGRASRYAEYFDIDWEPLSEELLGKVLVPVLGEQYGTVLEKGDLKLALDDASGSFSLLYHEHRFPIDPREYPRVTGFGLQRLAGTSRSGNPPPGLRDLEELNAAFNALPGRDETGTRRLAQRRDNIAALKTRLAQLYAAEPGIAAFIAENLRIINGVPGDAASFDRLHALIKAQAFRLAHWRVAAHDINYRRFFDINDLAALRMEKREVLADTHRLALRLVREGRAGALRIDHPDGLYDPQAYFERLQSAASPAPTNEAAVQSSTAPRIYLVLEKILAEHEHLPDHWPAHGTTGYRFANVLNGLYVDTAAQARMTKVYDTFVGGKIDFDELLHNSKMLIMNNSLASELSVLANMLNRIAKSDRNTCDFTLEGLRRTLREIVACFPVYRTYITAQGLSDDDRRHVDWAIALARRRNRASDLSVFDFARAALTRSLALRKPADRERLDRFIGRFQQFTAPVMAKSMEDTAFYIYHRLISLNEVGGDPRSFGLTLHAFHTASRERARQWPHTMLATSTHDNKRSEDVRARINVLSEMPGAWRLALRRWRHINRRKRSEGGEAAPSRNDEYLLYQVLLGTWPLTGKGTMDQAALDAYRQRIQRYMQKAVREAKLHTSWINPDEEYERGLTAFIDRLIGRIDANPFLADFLPAQERVAHYGMLNGISQMLVKFTSPGVPDIYQGNELWDFSLVDPDNRRPVDYPLREDALRALLGEFSSPDRDCSRQARKLLDNTADGRIKLYVIWRALALRRDHPALFEQGDYTPLTVTGQHAAHVCAYARRHQGEALVVIAPRLMYQLTGGEGGLPLGDVWKDTWLELPDMRPDMKMQWRDEMTGRTYRVEGDQPGLPLVLLLENFPVALLRPVVSG